MTPAGSVCDQGHGGAPVVDGQGNSVVFDPLPDAPMAGSIDPWERVRMLEGKLALLSSRNAVLQRALRGVVTRAFAISSRGTASWYQAALQALHTRNDDE